MVKKQSKKPFYKKPEWFIPIIISILLALFFGSKYVININNENMTVEGHNFQGDFRNAEISIRTIENQVDEYDVPIPRVYSKKFEITNDNLKDKTSQYDFFNVEFILPSNQKAFVDEYLYNKSVILGYCNEDISSCFINQKYRWNVNSTPCFTVEIFTNLHSQLTSTKYFENSEKCLRLVSGNDDFLSLFQ